MTELKPAIYLYFICACMLLPFFSRSQVTPITDSVSLQAFIIQRGDVVTLIYDSAYVLNKKLYKLYKETYNKNSKMNLVWEELSRSYTDLIKLQDSMLKSKELYYQQLKQSFDALAGNTNNFLTKTDGNLKEINESLNNATSNLENIKTSINNALNDLKLQKKQKTKLVAGGFVIGVTVTSLIFLLAK